MTQDTERESFEAWFTGQGWHDSNGEYREFHIRIAWTAWQARAARSDRDGVRYRWLRDNFSRLTICTLYSEQGHYIDKIELNDFGKPLIPESIDKAIDAAMADNVKGEVSE